MPYFEASAWWKWLTLARIWAQGIAINQFSYSYLAYLNEIASLDPVFMHSSYYYLCQLALVDYQLAQLLWLSHIRIFHLSEQGLVPRCSDNRGSTVIILYHVMSYYTLTCPVQGVYIYTANLKINTICDLLYEKGPIGIKVQFLLTAKEV